MQFLKFPIMIGWAITNKCNLKCVYCSQDSGNLFPDELTTKECFKVIDIIKQYKPSVIGFTGGEPFMRHDLDEIVTYSMKSGIRNVITTNGTLISGIPKELLIKFIKIRISLDSFSAEYHNILRVGENTFERVLNAIEIVKNLGIKVEIVTTISKKNYTSISDLFSFLQSLGTQSL